MLGHFFLVLSALFLFRALVDDGLARPHALAIDALNESEAMHRRLEQGLMPSLPVDRPGLSVQSSYRPGENRLQLGGDFIDVLDRGEAEIAVICGDVSGHGANAAALGAMLRASWQALCAAGVDVVTLVDSLREVIERERRNTSTYATVSLAWLDPRRSELRLISLGHPLPLLIAGASVAALPVQPIPPLGMWDRPVPDPPGHITSRRLEALLLHRRPHRGARRPRLRRALWRGASHPASRATLLRAVRRPMPGGVARAGAGRRL